MHNIHAKISFKPPLLDPNHIECTWQECYSKLATTSAQGQSSLHEPYIPKQFQNVLIEKCFHYFQRRLQLNIDMTTKQCYENVLKSLVLIVYQ